MFNITLQTDWGNKNGNGVSLLPEPATLTVEMPIAYDSWCRFDYDRAIAETEAQLQGAWGFCPDLRGAPTAEGGFEDSLKQMLVETLIRQDPDVLGDFSLDTSGMGGDGGDVWLPLVMGGSNHKFRVACGFGPEGKPDAGIIVEALAQAYREVFQLPGGQGVFSAAQQADLEQRAADWALGLLGQVGSALPKVEVNLESYAWVGNSLRLYIDVYDDPKVTYELLLPMSGKGELDFAGIEQVAARIAQDWSQRAGRGSSEGFSARIAEQIGPDAREYAAWIIEVENNIRAEFWEAMNREMAGNLKKAKDLSNKAEKWRQDYDKWLKGGANVKVEVEQEEPKPETKFSYSLSELPGQLLHDFKIIWDGLCELPGAAKKGMDKNLDEMVDGAIQGFRMAGVVFGEGKRMAIREVGIPAIIELGEYIIGELLQMRWEKKVGTRKAQFRGYVYQWMTFTFGRALVYYEVKRRMRQFPELALQVNKEILEVLNKAKIKKISNAN